MVAARCRKTASPDFMSTVPQPCRMSPSRREGTLFRDRHRIQMSGEHDPTGQTTRRTRQHGIAVADDLEARSLLTQRILDSLRNDGFVVRDAGDVDQGGPSSRWGPKQDRGCSRAPA